MRRRFLTGVVAALLAVVGVSTTGVGSAQAALIHHSGFEGGNTFEWAGVTGSPATMALLPKLTNPADLPASTGYGCAFSHDSTYLAVAHATTPFVTIYTRTGDTFAKLDNPADLPVGTGTGCAFSHDSTYLAVAHYTTPFVTIYKRTGDTFAKLDNPADLPAGVGNGCAFSHDSTYLAVAHATTPFVTIYKRTGDTFTKLDNPTDLPASTARGCAFSHDSTYLAVAHATTPFVTIYKRTGDTFVKLDNPADLPADWANGCAFSHDSTYLAVAHETTPRITIYKRTGDTFVKLDNPADLPAGVGNGCAFSHDSTYLAVAHYTTPFITIYKRTGDTFVKLDNPADLPAGTGWGCAFSHDSTYLAVAHYTTPFITIYKHYRTRTGKYILRCNTSSATAFVSGVTNPNRVKISLYIAAAPSGDTVIIGNGTANTAAIRLRTTRVLQLFNGTTQKGSDGTTAIPLNTWVDIELCLDPAAANDPAKVYINQQQEISANTDGCGSITKQVGVGTAVTADLWFDDIVFDNTGSTDSLGDIRVAPACLPNAAGTYSEFTPTGSATNFQNVDEPPPTPSDSDYNAATAQNKRDLYNIQDSGAIGIGASDTVQAVCVYARTNRASGGSNTQGWLVRDNSTDYNTTLTTGTSIAWQSIYYVQRPSGTAWTVDSLDAFQVGVKKASSDTKGFTVYTEWTMVAYTPAPSGEPDISVDPKEKVFGLKLELSSYWSKGSEPNWPLDDDECHFTITNNGGTCSITIKATNFTGGNGWTLISGSPGLGEVRLKAGKSGDANEAAMVILTTDEQPFISGLAASGTKKWELKLETGEFTDGVAKQSTITLTATLD